MVAYLDSIRGDVLAEWRKKSQSLIYQTDAAAWMWDVLGKRWWSTQAEIAQSFVDNTFNIVKSCNGVGKTQLAGDLVTWFVSVHPPEHTTVMVSAPVREQIDTMMFRYLNDNYRLAVERGKPLIGEITRWPKWQVPELNGRDIVLPKRPADTNLVSSFQGIHDEHVAVVLDEAGGLQEDFYIGANAVTTNKHARILAIGNPDQRNTAFHRRFTDREAFSDWKTFTIGAKDSPNFTGEKIYPEDPELDERVKGRLVQVSWAEMMRRSARPGVVAAKVDGQFPDSDDSTFFDQPVINKAWDTIIEPDSTTPRYLGVDLAYQGEDKCAAYMNWGGKVRLLDEWNRYDGTEHIESARRVHRLAIAHGISEVRVDMAGTGSGVYSNLRVLEEFAKRSYVLIGINGANRTPDSNRWLNARAWHYDQFRTGMANGVIDLDMADAELRTELEIQSAKFTLRNQLQITPKDEMRRAGIKSPDHLDAAIYSAVDTTPFLDGPAGGRAPGDVVMIDPFTMLGMDMAGMPI